MKIWIDCIRKESLVYSNLNIMADNFTSSPDENIPDITTPQETNDHNESTCRWSTKTETHKSFKYYKSKQVIRTNYYFNIIYTFSTLQLLSYFLRKMFTIPFKICILF